MTLTDTTRKNDDLMLQIIITTK